MIAFYADPMPNSQANTDIRPKVPLLNHINRVIAQAIVIYRITGFKHIPASVKGEILAQITPKLLFSFKHFLFKR